ncbi:MAG TPA: hypothetical protein VNB94_13410 [Mycobacteriales bacterium]|nr:hypothetical protein [Mycobacteriales bacterium]
MSDYFDPPQRPTEADQWTPPPGQSVPHAWSPSGPSGPSASGLWRSYRPRPHLGALVGVVGGLLVTGGLAVLLATLGEKGESKALLAGLIAALVVAGLVVTLSRLPRGPVRAAVVTGAFLLAVAPMGFWLQTADSIGFKAAAALFLVVPTAVWTACFLIGATRGRLVFLSGALVGLWLLASVLAVDTGGGSVQRGSATYTSSTEVLTAEPFPAAQESPEDADGDGVPDQFDPDFLDPNGTASGSAQDSDGDGVPDEFDGEPFDGGNGGAGGSGEGFGTNGGFDPSSLVPSLFGFPFLFGFGAGPGAVGIVALLFGVGYLAAAATLDRSDRAGTATPFQAVGIVALVTALSALGEDLGDVGSALASLVAGAGLLWLGTTARRRLTSWVGAALAFGGLVAFVIAVVEDAVPAGILLLVLGLGVVAAAQAVLTHDDGGDDSAEPWAHPSDAPPATPVA